MERENAVRVRKCTVAISNIAAFDSPNRNILEKSSRNFVIVILLVDEVEAKPLKVVFLARATASTAPVQL